MIQLTRNGTVFTGSVGDLESLSEEFDRQNCVQFPALLQPGLLQLIQDQVDQAEFQQRIHEGIAAEAAITSHPVLSLLHLVVNDPKLLEIIKQITGCGRIGCFTGRVYRMRSDSGHYDSWHTDVETVQGRLVAMSINLSKEIYSGGILQIRDRGSGQIVHEVANVGFGDGIIFCISPHLQHRVSNVESIVAKTAFAGWFRSQVDFLTLLKKKSPE